MFASLMLGTLLSAPAAHADVSVELRVPQQSLSLGADVALHPAEATYSLGIEDELGMTPALKVSSAELRDTREQLRRGQAVYAVGGTTLLVGGATAAVGTAVAFVGFLNLVSDGGEELFIAGIFAMAGGVLIAAVSVPIMIAGGWIAADAMADAGISYSKAPMWFVAGGAALLVSGAILSSSDAGEGLSTLGLASMLGGGTAQMIVINRAFRAYEPQHGGSASWRVAPMLSPDVRGVALAARF